MARGLSERANQNVLETAAELFADPGIDGTSMDAIAVASGVSKATIYKHWADKEALCLEVLVKRTRAKAGLPGVARGGRG
jgi:AcrR family transcriptional regulator